MLTLSRIWPINSKSRSKPTSAWPRSTRSRPTRTWPFIANFTWNLMRPRSVPTLLRPPFSRFVAASEIQHKTNISIERIYKVFLYIVEFRIFLSLDPCFILLFFFKLSKPTGIPGNIWRVNGPSVIKTYSSFSSEYSTNQDIIELQRSCIFTSLENFLRRYDSSVSNCLIAYRQSLDPLLTRSCSGKSNASPIAKVWVLVHTVVFFWDFPFSPSQNRFIDSNSG